MDAIFRGTHSCCAEALEDSEICEIPFSLLEELFSDMPVLLHRFHRLMNREIELEQSALLALGHLRADQRFASFLLGLASRYHAHGYAADRFLLRMSRHDIAAYLALTIETISRVIAQFQNIGLISVDNRVVRLLDIGKLTALSEKRDDE